MIKKTITYTDFDGSERTEEAYFNLNKSELVDMDLDCEGGVEAYLKKIVDTQDAKAINKFFKQIILSSYGIKSDDGRRFVKSDELKQEFSQSMLYDELYSQLIFNADLAEEFVNGIIPTSLK